MNKNIYKNGTLVKFLLHSRTYIGFIIGTCSTDNYAEDNAYVIRYIETQDNYRPKKPYTIVDMAIVSPVLEFDDSWEELFYIVDYSSKLFPSDRCNEWELEEDISSGNYIIIPK